MDYSYIIKLLISAMIFAPGLIILIASLFIGGVALFESLGGKVNESDKTS